MYESSDPRSALDSVPAEVWAAGPIAEPRFVDFSVERPVLLGAERSPTWIVRGQNFVVALTRLEAGDRLERDATQDEYMVITTHADATASVTAGSRDASWSGPAVVIVPSGRSSITADAPTELIRLFDIRTADVARLASNADDYREDRPRVTPLRASLNPSAAAHDRGQEDIRVHRVAEVEARPDRFGRIYRSRTLMVNLMYPSVGPRDRTRLSPHHHDDFEQGSLAVAGTFEHHVRTPWTTDMTEWREDQHRSVGSPSLAIIPPPIIHTSRATGEGSNVLIDVFSPPRADFLSRPGWVLNAADYADEPDAASPEPAA